MATPSYSSPTPQERWHRFSAAAVRAFHRYATWLVSLSWWRFGWYALLLIIATGLIQKLPPFSMTYYETIVDTVSHRKAKQHAMPIAPAAPPTAEPLDKVQPLQKLQPLEKPEQPEKPEKAEKAEKPEPAESAAGKSSKTVDIQLPGIIVNTKDHTIKNKGVNITFTGRFMARDKPGILGAIASVLGRNGISIASVIQQGRGEEEETTVPVIMRTHEAYERNLKRALAAITRQKLAGAPPAFIRIEERL